MRSMSLLLLLPVLSACPPAPPGPDDDDSVDDDDVAEEVDCTAAAWARGWERIGDAPVFEPTGWEGTFIRPTSVVPLPEGGFRLFYVSATLVPCGDGDTCLSRVVGIADSEDGLAWDRVGDGPVMDRRADEVDVGHGTASRGADGSWTWLYGRAEGVRRVGIARAVSTDGLVWSVPDDDLVLPTGEPGAWDEMFTGAPAALDEDRMLYTGAGPGGAALGLAVREGESWSRGDVSPLLSPGPAGSYDEDSVTNPSVVEVGGCFVLAYKASSNATPPDDESIGVAVSRDGAAWDRGEDPALEITRDYEADGVVDPALFVHDGHVWMLYGALDADFVNTVALARIPIPRP